MFVYKKFKASDAGILAFEAHKEYNVDSDNSASLDISFVNTKYSSASLDTYSGIGDLNHSKRYRQVETLLYKGGPQNYGNLLGGFNYIDQEKRLYGRANVLEISQRNAGNGIQKGTFDLNGAYKDDSKGNIYDSTEVILINGYAQNYPKETEKCFYLGPVRGYKYTDLNYEIRTGRLIVNAPTTYNDKSSDDSIYLNSVEYVSCSIEYMDGDLSEYTGINLDEGYVKIAHSNNFNFSDEDFTVSFWYKAPDTSGTKYLVSKGFTKTVASIPTSPKLKESGSDSKGLTGRQEVDAGNSYPFAIYAEGSTLNFERSDENGTSKVSATLSAALTHYTFVKDGSTLRAYANAVAGNTSTDNTNNCGNQADLFIGNKGGSRSSDYNIDSAGGNISQILILNKAATADEIENIKDSINGSPFVGNIFYENGIATITKPNIAANTLISAETTTGTLTLGTIPNDTDPDYVDSTIQEVVWDGELTFFTTSSIFELDNPNKSEVDLFPGVILTPPTTTEEGSSNSFILTSGDFITTSSIEIYPLATAFNFKLLDASSEVSNSFEGITYGEDGFTAKGESIEIEGSLLTDIGYPESEGEYAFYHPPQTTMSASFIFNGINRNTSRVWQNGSGSSNLSSWFNNTLVAEEYGTTLANYDNNVNRTYLSRRFNSGINQIENSEYVNEADDLEGPLQIVTTNNTSQSGVPVDGGHITNATAIKGFRKVTNDAFGVITGSRGNIASIKNAKLQLSRSQDTEESFVTASNTTYDTNLYFPGGIQNGEFNPFVTSSEYTHLNSHPNIYSGIGVIDNRGIGFRSAQLLGGKSGSAIYDNLDTINLSVNTSVSPSGSAGGQDFQYKLVYYHDDDSSYWDMFDTAGDKCESNVFEMPANPNNNDYGAGSVTFTISPTNLTLEKIDDASSPDGWNPFEDQNDRITFLFKTDTGTDGGVEPGILINNGTQINITSQTPDFGPQDTLYLESDYIYPLVSASHLFTINGITTDSASLVANAVSATHYTRGFITNLSSSFYQSQSFVESFGSLIEQFTNITVPLALRVELVEFDIDENNPSPTIPDFFSGGKILTSSLYPVGTNIGGNFTDTISVSEGASGMALDGDFSFEITKSVTEECAVAWRMGIVNADNPGDLTDVNDFPLIPVNSGEGFAFSGINISSYQTSATYSLSTVAGHNSDPLTNNELRAIFNNTASIKHTFVGEIEAYQTESINNLSLIQLGTLPTAFTGFGSEYSLSPGNVEIYFDTEFLITQSKWVVSASYQPALPVQISSSFNVNKRALYEIYNLESLYFHNPQDPLDEFVPLSEDFVSDPEKAPQLQYKIFIDGTENEDFTQTSSFAPNRLQIIYDRSEDLVGYLGGLDEDQIVNMEVTLVSGSEGNDFLAYPHQGIALKKLNIIGISSSAEARKADNSAFTEQEATAISASVYSPHLAGGDSLVPFSVGDPLEAIHIVSFSGGSTGREIMHLGLDYFTTESHELELEFAPSSQPIEITFPFNYEANRTYDFKFGGGSVTLEALGDELDLDAGLGFKILDAGGGVIEGSPHVYATSGQIFSSADDFSISFGESGAGSLIFFSSGSSEGDYTNGNISASYNIELSNIDVEIIEFQGSNTSNEVVNYTGDIAPNNITIDSAHVDAGSHGLFTIGEDTYNISGFFNGNVQLGTTLFITASSEASATIDQNTGFDYTQTPEVTVGTIDGNMIGGTFEFTDATGTTTTYTIIDVGGSDITLSSNTTPAEGFDNQILVAPDPTQITITFNQPVDNDSFSLAFKNNHLIFENEFQCTVDENEYNFTLNPTARKYKSIDKGELADFATGSNFRPYVTTIGLYNEDNELLVVGKLAQPVRMSEETDTTFVVRYDT
jgi:hypothetical protein